MKMLHGGTRGAQGGNASSELYLTVSTALSLMNPAVLAVMVVLPAARPAATPRSVIVALKESLLVHITLGVPTTVTGKGFAFSPVLWRLPNWP